MKIFISAVAAIGLALYGGGAVLAQGMMDSAGVEADDHTAREEAEGQQIWASLRAEDLACEQLTEGQHASLGEYFMGQMLGDSHSAMNTMMTHMIGEEGEEEMHVVMGQRMSGCEPDIAFPAGGAGFVPMMQMMMGVGVAAED